MRFSVNLSTVFTEVPFLERFEKASQAGFSYVECQFPYLYKPEQIKEQLTNHQLKMVLINLPPGNWEAGDRGLASDKSREQEFRDSVDLGIAYATALGVQKIHCMAGVLIGEKSLAKQTFLENVSYAATKFQEHGLTLLLEPINPVDMPNYFLASITDAVAVIDELKKTNIKLQFDFYHIQKIQGNLLETFQRVSSYISHVQIADVPGRHEPGTGEINFKNLFHFLQNNYEGFIGLEYNPKYSSEKSFAWMKECLS